MVKQYLANPTDKEWERYKKKYLIILRNSWEIHRHEFDELAENARQGDYFLGCNCPTTTNPNLYHCHNALALQFMKRKYPDLGIDYVPINFPDTFETAAKNDL